MINIVLHEPEIPQNTGNIARSCAATGANLHLIEPLGFDISEKAVKRSGLDYWNLVNIFVYKNIEEFFEKNPDGNFYFATTKASKTYSEMEYKKPTFLIFGKETKGLPEDLIEKNLDTSIRIPMIHEARSLNLSNAVAIVLYETLKQNNFNDLLKEGFLPTGENKK
ncbi:MAG: tRNA (uridine(34)/cytosine(34)/5-carboxymethylaminomethyluridine(34)-2'-O)-methyltransferase TrmL [Clostridia bacterium]